MKRAIEIIRTWSADKIELIFLKIIFKYLLYFLVFSTVIVYVYIFNHSSTTYTKVLSIFLVFVILFILLSKLLLDKALIDILSQDINLAKKKRRTKRRFWRALRSWTLIRIIVFYRIITDLSNM